MAGARAGLFSSAGAELVQALSVVMPALVAGIHVFLAIDWR